MKSILISIKPKYVADILNHKKTIEIRKTMPKCDLPIDVYIYCTKDKETIAINPYGGYAVVPNKYKNEYFNVKVDAKFTLNKVEHFEREYLSRYIDDYYYDNGEPLNKKFYKNTCLTENELFDYIGGKGGYAWHISNLEIFDKPMELWQFGVKHSPQSFCYVEVDELWVKKH